MATAIDATTTVLNAYGDNAFEVSKIHDIFVQTQDKGKISVDELGKSIGRVVPAASSLGVNLDQLGASYAILTAKGQNAQLATTNLNAMLSELGATGSKSDKALREMAGKSFAELTKEGKTVGDVLGMLDEYAKANDLSLKDMFGSMNAGSAALTLLSDGVEGYNAMLKEMDGATGKTAENARTMEDGWFKINKAMTQVKNTLIDAGAVLAPYIEMAATKVSELTERFNALDEGTKSNIMKFIGLAAAAGPVILGVSKIIGVVSSVISIGGKLVGGINTVMGVLGGPLTLALAGAVVAGIALYKNWDKIKEWASKAWEGIVTTVEGAVSKIKGYWEGLKNFLKNPIKGVINIFKRDNGDEADVDGSHATGLDYVNKDGYIGELHKGEMVLTKSTADKFRELGGSKDKVPEVLTRNVVKNISNVRNIDKSKHNIDESSIITKLIRNISNVRNIDKSKHSIDESSTVTKLTRNISNVQNIDKSIQYIETENYNNYKAEKTKPVTIDGEKELPTISLNPVYNIEIKGNVTEKEVNELTDKIDERTRRIFYELFYELSLKMA